jgi:hypothetical protein
MLTDGETVDIILGVMAIILAIIIPFLIERLKRPRFVVRIDDDIPFDI